MLALDGDVQDCLNIVLPAGSIMEKMARSVYATVLANAARNAYLQPEQAANRPTTATLQLHEQKTL